MKVRSKEILILSFVFFAVGLIWASSIYLRCTKALPSETFLSATQTKQVLSLMTSTGGSSFVAHPFPYLRPISILGIFEVLCMALYLYAGFAMMRGYRFDLMLARITLYVDLLLKFSVAGFIQQISLAYRFPLDTKNILITYYIPDSTLWSRLSGILSGAAGLLTGGNLLLGIFLIYLLLCFYLIIKNR